MCETDGGSTQESLVVDEGFWRIHSTSTEIYRCPLPKACSGGENFTSSANYIFNGAGYCNDGYYGPLCGVCANDAAGPNIDYYFNPDTQTCDVCSELEDPAKIFSQSPTLITFTAILTVSFIFILKTVFCNDAAALDSKVELTYIWLFSINQLCFVY